MNRTKLFGLTVIAIFVLSVSAQTATVSSETSYIETNFELFYYTASGSRTSESYALYIKQALAPLGIDVRIFAKPFGQFVGDLLHSTAGRPFDLAHVRFGGGGATPDFGWHYASYNFYFGGAMLQLDNPTWQAWQVQDTGLNNTDIDDMIDEIDYDLNLTSRYDNFESFNQLYFDKLLYDLPLVGLSSRVSMWKGYGGAANELWFPQEGVMPSRALGASWTADTPAERKSNDTTLILSTTEPNSENFDPAQSTDSAQTDMTRYMHQSLITTDSDWLPHPDLAWNWAFGVAENGTTYDHDRNATTAEITDDGNVMKFTFFLRDNAYWSATTDADGNAVAAKKVDANDFMLTYNFWQTFLNRSEFSVNGEYNYDGLLYAEKSTTLFPDDTFSIYYNASYQTPDDLLTYGGLSPLPSHLLGGSLTYTNTTSSITYNEVMNPSMSFNPWDSKEWIQWTTYEGHSLVGPYDIVGFEAKSHYAYQARDDWYYPNEWDVDTYYVGTDAEMQAWETFYGTTFDTWAPMDARMTDKQEAYYWAYNGTETNMQKPTTQNIENFVFLVIVDVNNRLLKFEAGELDVFSPTALGADQVEKHESDPKFVVKSLKLVNRGPELLVFNLLSDHLKKINVRKAISKAIDRDKLVSIHDGFANPWYSIAYPNSGIWDSVQATGQEYSYETARDLMKLEGYQAADSNENNPQADVPGLGEVAGVLGLPGFELLAALFAVFVAVPIVRRRR